MIFNFTNDTIVDYDFDFGTIKVNFENPDTTLKTFKFGVDTSTFSINENVSLGIQDSSFIATKPVIEFNFEDGLKNSTLFHFGKDELGFNFNRLGDTRPIFDFTTVQNLSTFVNLQGSLDDSVGSINVTKVVPILRPMTNGIVSFVEDAVSVNNKVYSENAGVDFTSPNICSDSQLTQSITAKISSFNTGFEGLEVSLHSHVEQSVLIKSEVCNKFNVLTQNSDDWCIVVDKAVSLKSKFKRSQGLLTFSNEQFKSIVQDTRYNRQYNYQSYYNVEQSGYSPLNDMVLTDVSIAVDILIPVYNPVEPYSFNFTNNSQDITNAVENYTYYANSSSYSPITDFILTNDYLTRYKVNKGDTNGTLVSKLCDDYKNVENVNNHFCENIEPACPLDVGESVWIDPPPPEPPVILDSESYTIPSRGCYIMDHIITVTLSDLTTEIYLSNIGLSSNSDSFAWAFSSELIDHSQQSIIEDNTELHITINGIKWVVIVEDISISESFGNKSVSLSGRGITAKLSEPFHKPTSQSFDSDLTIQQIADLQMPIGWSIVWNAPVWVVNAGSFSYYNATPAQVLLKIAKDAGLVLIPDKENQIFTFQPKYPIKPWNFEATTANVVIPNDVVTSISKISPIVQTYNAVYVHGEEGGGEIALCRLAGTAGDVLGETVSNNIMTDITALRSLGETVLADLSTQPIVKSAKIPFDNDDIPLIEIGNLVEVDGSKGIVNSISVNASFGEVTQSFQVGNTSNNVWADFKNLLPKEPLLIGNISSVSGNSSIVTLVDGGVVRVIGTGTVGNNYYVKGGTIQSTAPTLTSHNIVI